MPDDSVRFVFIRLQNHEALSYRISLLRIDCFTARHSFMRSTFIYEKHFLSDTDTVTGTTPWS